MDWNSIVSYLPEGLCALLCLLGCLCNWVRTGSIKTAIEKACPSFTLVVELSERVDALEKRLDDLRDVIERTLAYSGGDQSDN